MEQYKRGKSTSWQKVSGWYNKLVDREGHYYHKHIVMPGAWRLLNLKKDSSILDLACGQGILARHIPKNVYYQGVDIARSLIEFAKKQGSNPLHNYQVLDITKPLNLSKKDFSHAAVILALQNIEFPLLIFENANKHLISGGKLLIVINHPYFRIPRQTSWEIDKETKIQYRRVNRYLSPLKIPITNHPGKGANSSITWSFHYSLSEYSKLLSETGFVIEKIEEWTSDKESIGTASKMENRSRSEFPLFMAILARKDN